MKRLLWAAFILPLLYVVPAAGEQAPDFGFIKDEPYRKQKQTVCTSSIVTAHDALVVKEAITPIMRLLVGMTFAELPPAVDKDILTEHGRRVLRMPPPRNGKKRYSIASVGEWRVCSGNQLSFAVTYHDLFRKNPWKTRLIFEQDGGSWRFKDHGNLDDPSLDCK